jgi:hypothetical protein
MGLLQPDVFLEWDSRVVEPASVSRDGWALRASFGERGEVEDRVVERSGDGRITVVQRTWRLRGTGRLRIGYAVSRAGAARHWVVPAGMYDGNAVGEGRFPRGGAEVGWAFREDRCALPSASFVSDGTGCEGLWTMPAGTEADLSCVRTSVEDGRVRLAVEWPLAEGPVAYRRKWYPLGGPRRGIRRWQRIDGEWSATRRFVVFESPGGGIAAMHDALRWWWERSGDPAGGADWGEIVRSKVEHVAANLWVRDARSTGFVQARLLHLPVLNTLSAGFLGRNVELALSLYRVGVATDQPRLRAIATGVADFFGGGRLPNGLFRTDWQRGAGRWVGMAFPRRDTLSTRMMGEAGVAFLRLSDAARAAGEDGSRWFDQARALGDFFVGSLPADGNPGKWWTADGVRVDATGTNGAYIVGLLAELHARTGDPRVLSTLRRAADVLAGSASRGDLSGDTLDALCIDKEAGQAVLRALLAAWRRTGDPSHLDGAVAAARFTQSWVFGWDVPFAPSTPLGRRSFRTTGGTAVSVAHHHLDPYGVAIALDFLRLGAATGDPHWRRVARWMTAYVAQLVSSPRDPLGRAARFHGWQPEQVNHTDWAYWSSRATPRGSFYSDIAWVPALTLGALLDLRDEFPDEVAFPDLPPRLPGERDAPAFGPIGRWVGRWQRWA